MTRRLSPDDYDPTTGGVPVDVTSPAATAGQVADVVAATLGVDRGRLAPSTPLFGSLPELDSMAVVEIVVALEERFGITIDEEDLTAETFATVASLAGLVTARRSA